MSYIRSLSNPEELYIWSDGKTVNIWHGVRKPHSSGSAFTIPQGAFNTVCKLSAAFRDPARCRGVVVEEVRVDRRTGEIVPPWKPCPKCVPAGKNAWSPCRACTLLMTRSARRSDYKVRLSYKGNFVTMWRVTWDYVIRRFRV